MTPDTLAIAVDMAKIQAGQLVAEIEQMPSHERTRAQVALRSIFDSLGHLGGMAYFEAIINRANGWAELGAISRVDLPEEDQDVLRSYVARFLRDYLMKMAGYQL